MMTRIPVPGLAAATILLALAAALASCQNTEEDTSQVPTVGLTASPVPGTSSVTPSSTAAVPDGWGTYTDRQLGFSLPHPPGLSPREQSIDLPGKDGIPATQLRVISFDRADAVPVVGVSATANPAGLPLEEWISRVPGWPCDPMGYPTCVPTEVTVAGERGIRFAIDTLGEPAATIYFAHSGFIYSLSGNLFGSGEGGYPAALSEADFQRIITELRFAGDG